MSFSDGASEGTRPSHDIGSGAQVSCIQCGRTSRGVDTCRRGPWRSVWGLAIISTDHVVG